MNPPFPQSIHPCLCAHALTNKADALVSICAYETTDVEHAAESHLDLCTRRSRHQLRNLPQINAASQVHLPGVDLQNVQTGLFTQNVNVNIVKTTTRKWGSTPEKMYLFIWRGKLNLPVNPAWSE